MDNASNCDTAVTELAKLIPSFRGTSVRTRCFAHTVNLVAKVSSFKFRSKEYGLMLYYKGFHFVLLQETEEEKVCKSGTIKAST